MLSRFPLFFVAVAALAQSSAAHPSQASFSPYQAVNPLLLAETFERFDLDQAAMDERKYVHNPEAMLKTEHGVPTRKQYNANLFATDRSMIAVEFVCAPPPWAAEAHAKTCAKVQNAFNGVFQHIEDSFELKRPIKVKFEYSSFCAYPNGASGGNLDAGFRFKGASKNGKDGKMSKPAECASSAEQLGLAAPAALWIPETADPATGLKYSYPQALVKQLMADSKNNINFNEYDIFARFNADQESGLWYKDDGTTIASSQYDFQYIVLHEFMHGMGMVSSWNMAFDGLESTRGGPRGSQMLAPILSSGNQNDVVSMPQTTTVFDKYISTTRKMPSPTFLNKYASAIMGAVQTLPRGATLASFFKATLLSAAASEAAQSAFRAATTDGALQFSFPDGTSMLLHTEENRYRPGTSVVHVNYNEYTGTTEFLMRPYANNGATLLSLGKGKVFGPLTLKIFETMGYTIKQGAPGARRAAAAAGVQAGESAQASAQSGSISGAAQSDDAAAYNWVMEGQAAESNSAGLAASKFGAAALLVAASVFFLAV